MNAPPSARRLGTFVIGLAFSTGWLVAAAPVAAVSGLDIHDIQGSGHVSPYGGQVVTDVDGIVTAVSGNGFWMNDPAPDGLEATSEGLFVFRGSSGTKPPVGALVTVNGTVSEFRPGGAGGFENLATTQLTSTTFTVVTTGNPLPVMVVGVGGRVPPTTVIDDDTLPAGGGGDGTIDGPGAVTTFDPANDGIDFYESLEGMRLQVNGAVAVGPRNSFGEIAVVGDGGLVIRPGDFNPERIIIDDVLASTPATNVGDTFAEPLIGVLDYSFGNYKLLVTSAPIRVDNGLTREVTRAARREQLAVATFNVENLAATSSPTKVAELATLIVNHLRAPDLLAIEEIQDNNGPVDDGAVAADLSWQALVNTIVAAGGPAYQFRQIDPQNNADGGQPGGNIRVGFLFRTDRGLQFVDRPGGDAVTDTNVVPGSGSHSAQLTISPGRILPDPSGPWATSFTDTRKSLAGEFRWRGEELFVVVNHFSSKNDDHPLVGRFQPPLRFTEFESGTPEDGWRHAQAQVVNEFVDEILAVDRRAKVVVLGDINDFQFSETVGVLTGLLRPVVGASPDADGSGATAPTGERAVLSTLVDRLGPAERYSYVFEGNSQILDQILVSGAIGKEDPAYDVVHVNAEFAAQASDHEPSVMRVELD